MEHATFTLHERRTETEIVFELLERPSGKRVGIARAGRPAPFHSGRLQRWSQSLLDRHRTLGAGVAVLIALFALVAFITSFLLNRKLPKRERPRLILREGEDQNHQEILRLKQSSGMFYDSRVVEDGRGREIARFRGPSKIPLGELSFGIIDLAETSRDASNDDSLPWLGVVDPANSGVFVLSLVGLPNAGRVTEHRAFSHAAKVGVNSYEIEAGSDLKKRDHGLLLLFGVALALAWKPRL